MAFTTKQNVRPSSVQEQAAKTNEELVCQKRGYALTKTILGSGAYAKVKLAYVSEAKKEKDRRLAKDLDYKGHNKVAVKIVNKKQAPQEYLVKFMPREIDALNATCRHHNVIQLYETFQTDSKIYLIMEFASKGDLLEYVNSRSRRKVGIGEETAKHIFRQLVEGMAHCHARNVVHRDLKCENILLDDNNVVKISDFGFATRYPTNKRKFLDTFCGSYAYAAPEILQAQKYDGKFTDAWSLGIILYAIMCGKLPFNDNSLHSLVAQVKGKLTFPLRANCPSACQHLIRGILTWDPQQRLTVNEILNHPWLEKSEKKKNNEIEVISSFFGPTNDLKKDKIRNDTNPSPNPTQLQPKCDVTNVTKPARDDKRQTPTTAMTRDRTGTPVPRRGWASKSPEPCTTTKLLHRRTPRPLTRTKLSGLESVESDTPDVESLTHTPCPRSTTPAQTPQPINRRELQVKLAKFVSGVARYPATRSLNRETFAVMSKTLQQASKRGEETPHLTRMKDNTEKMYLKYISNMTTDRKSPGKPLSRGHEQRQYNNDSKTRNEDFPTVVKQHLSKKIVPTPPPRVKKIVPTPPAAKVTTHKPLSAVRKVVITAKPKVPTSDSPAQPTSQEKPEGYSGHFRTVIGNGRQVLNRDMQIPKPPTYVSPRTIRNKMVPSRSALRKRPQVKCGTKHVWFNDIRYGKI